MPAEAKHPDTLPAAPFELIHVCQVVNRMDSCFRLSIPKRSETSKCPTGAGWSGATGLCSSNNNLARLGGLAQIKLKHRILPRSSHSICLGSSDIFRQTVDASQTSYIPFSVRVTPVPTTMKSSSRHTDTSEQDNCACVQGRLAACNV